MIMLEIRLAATLRRWANQSGAYWVTASILKWVPYLTPSPAPTKVMRTVKYRAHSSNQSKATLKPYRITTWNVAPKARTSRV